MARKRAAPTVYTARLKLRQSGTAR